MISRGCKKVIVGELFYEGFELFGNKTVTYLYCSKFQRRCDYEGSLDIVSKPRHLNMREESCLCFVLAQLDKPEEGL